MFFTSFLWGVGLVIDFNQSYFAEFINKENVNIFLGGQGIKASNFVIILRLSGIKCVCFVWTWVVQFSAINDIKPI